MSEYVFKGLNTKIFINGVELKLTDGAEIIVKHEPPPPEPIPYLSKSVYLASPDDPTIIVGVHQSGDEYTYDDENGVEKTDFYPMESWVNVYTLDEVTKERKFGYSAIRFSNHIESEVDLYLKDGWILLERKEERGTY